MSTKVIEAIDVLADKSKCASAAHEAMQYAQAAQNLAQTAGILAEIERHKK